MAFIDPNTKEFLTEEHIDQVFSVLIDNGYTLEYEMTKLLKDNKLVCLISNKIELNVIAYFISIKCQIHIQKKLYNLHRFI